MTYNELRYTLAAFNRWRSENKDKYEKISNYLGTEGKCLSLFEYHTNLILKRCHKEFGWDGIYKQVSLAMKDFLNTCMKLEDIEAEDYITMLAESIPQRFGFTKM